MLGTGSFGRVSLAQHIATGRICAIKALSKANIVKNQQVPILPCYHQHASLCKPTLLAVLHVDVTDQLP